VLIVLILSMMVLPLPPFLLDLLFTFNIAMSVMVLLVSMYTMKALDFAAFPAVLLFSTLLRLSLNVASTRVVLMHGHTGPDAAGKVIEAFGHFLVGGNFAVGVMVFIILVLINFMVITKGAGRIAEVGARFMLDAMPGKQMAIDADLNAGLIGEEVARKRRTEVSQEADFYGSMDGASKFVRGDAVAGLLIMVINIIGGLVVGMVQHGLDFGTAGKTYTLLAIGDGLVAQIPALVISTAAGVIVSRVTTDEDVGRQLTGQLFSNPQVLFLTAGIIGLMGMIPGMPNLAFLLIAGGLVWLGRRLLMRKHAQAAAEQAAEAHAAAAPAPEGRGHLGRRGAGRPAGHGSRLPADPAGGPDAARRTAGPHQEHPQEDRAGDRLPGAGGAHPRQPGDQAQHLRHQPEGRGDRPRRGLPQPVDGDQPGPGHRHLARHADAGPGLRPARGVDRRQPAPAGAGATATRWSMPAP
jgi:flagellar biosynthesis protein FlhA